MVFNCPIVRPLNAFTRGGALSLFCAKTISSFPFALGSFVTIQIKKKKKKKERETIKMDRGRESDQTKQTTKKKKNDTPIPMHSYLELYTCPFYQVLQYLGTF
jgi:hypothetical protein